MKKLFVAAVLVLGGFATQAATTVNSDGIAIVASQEEFKEIAVEEVPEAISAALAKDYKGATISKAYVNEAKEYKLEIAMGDKTGVLYANESGEWIQK
ncbi:hypothetical protein LS482_13885 [Sinomicrobium kalidii]|uniref:hypothetical protein n=1 Tax=Sinomicrobium kalidii TaxID=2900738 RepID=UPI001E4DEDE5|nr:hypothetical protein [Sinomicrobium kalidii]UGU14782.1 hypothetical protein LS482_13885 [Sinomicrobium kalidii]